MKDDRLRLIPLRMTAALDMASGKAVAQLPIVGDVDDLFYDPSRKLVFVIGGEAIDLFRQRSPDHYDRIGRVATAPGARTGLYHLEPSLFDLRRLA
jgi:hypothetical protein